MTLEQTEMRIIEIAHDVSEKNGYDFMFLNDEAIQLFNDNIELINKDMFNISMVRPFFEDIIKAFHRDFKKHMKDLEG
jgi:hypothetical protein